MKHITPGAYRTRGGGIAIVKMTISLGARNAQSQTGILWRKKGAGYDSPEESAWVQHGKYWSENTEHADDLAERIPVINITEHGYGEGAARHEQ